MFDRRDDDYSIEELGVLNRRLREAAGVDPASPATHAIARRRLFAPRRLAIAGLACAAIVAFAAVVLTPKDERRGEINGVTRGPVALTPLSTRVAISRLAQLAATGGLPFARGDQFFHASWQRTIRAGGVLPPAKPGEPNDRFTVIRTETEDRWVSLDRPGASRTWIKSVEFPTARDRRLATAYGEGGARKTTWAGYSPQRFYGFGRKTFTREELINYRPTPERLIHDLFRRPIADYPGAAGAWVSLTETMTSNSLPVHLRATLIRALGIIPGVEARGLRRDRIGRRGYVFKLEHNGLRDEILLDARTAQVLELRTVVVRPEVPYQDARPGTLVQDQLLTRSEVVDDLPAYVQHSPAFIGHPPAAAISQERRQAAEQRRRDKLAVQKR